MSLEHRLFYGFITIALLTAALVVTNTHRVVVQFLSDKIASRLFFYLGGLVLMGYLILHSTYRLFDHVLTASQAQMVESATGVGNF